MSALRPCAQARRCRAPPLLAACRAVTHNLPSAERDQRRADTPRGICVGCGTALPQLWRCPNFNRDDLWQMWRAADGHIRFHDEGWAWLAVKLRLDADDERLPEIAQKLAQAGKLLIFTTSADAVIAFARPKPCPTQPRPASAVQEGATP